MTLKAGDIITTGTQVGVGLRFSTPIYLKNKQTMHLSIKNLASKKKKLMIINKAEVLIFCFCIMKF